MPHDVITVGGCECWQCRNTRAIEAAAAPAHSSGKMLDAAPGSVAPLKKRGAGQTLKDFEEMMERLKTYLPVRKLLSHKIPKPWRLSDEILFRCKRQNDAMSDAREKL